MDLIPIPQEESALSSSKTKIASRKQTLIKQLRSKMKLKEVSRDKKLLGSTCLKLIQYVTEEDLSVEELKKLLSQMERSVISLQRCKKTLLEKKKKKR